MKRPDFAHAVDQIIQNDNRYHPDAYEFVSEALDHTVKMLKKPATGPQRHVTAAELLEGIRVCALNQFGPLAKTVLNHWGVHRCEDFGEIVFNLVDAGVLGKTEDDKKEDFAGGFDFDRAFCDPFRPNSKQKKTARPQES